ESARRGSSTPYEITQLRRRVESTIRALSDIADQLAGIPGRKSLIWVTAGYPAMVDFGLGSPRQQSFPFDNRADKAIQKLNNADVAVYPIDARGTALSQTGFSSSALRQPGNSP